MRNTGGGEQDQSAAGVRGGEQDQSAAGVRGGEQDQSAAGVPERGCPSVPCEYTFRCGFYV